MPRNSFDRAPAGWMPPGHRWGLGSQSVLPYLSHSALARVFVLNQSLREDGPVRNPVFSDMVSFPLAHLR